jgi:hypothetical protein
VLQAGGADAVGPLLVFLDLLERQPEGVSEIGLAHIKHEPSDAHAAANMLVDRIKGAFRHRSPPTGCTLSNLACLWRSTMRLVAACQVGASGPFGNATECWASALARLRLFRSRGQAAWRNALEPFPHKALPTRGKAQPAGGEHGVACGV